MAVAQISTTTTTPVPLTSDQPTSTINQVNVIEALTTDTQIEVQAVLPATLEPSLRELIKQTSIDYGIDPRSALAVARCESRLKQYNEIGEVLRGEVNRYDVGVFQINEKYHLEKSRELGFDIYTSEGNVEYAIWLMDNYGRRPWVWSRHCWRSK